MTLWSWEYLLGILSGSELWFITELQVIFSFGKCFSLYHKIVHYIDWEEKMLPWGNYWVGLDFVEFLYSKDTREF